MTFVLTKNYCTSCFWATESLDRDQAILDFVHTYFDWLYKNDEFLLQLKRGKHFLQSPVDGRVYDTVSVNCWSDKFTFFGVLSRDDRLFLFQQDFNNAWVTSFSEEK